MNKCYLLLRDNKETGPYSLPDLLQLSLTDNDLIWVEGKSAGWRYPFEMEELKEAVSDVSHFSQSIVNSREELVAATLQEEPIITRKKIFVSMPAGAKKQAITTMPYPEEKTETLRHKAVSFPVDKKTETEVSYDGLLIDSKEEYAGAMQGLKKKQKHFKLNRPAACTALFVAIITFSVFVLQWHPQKERPATAFTTVTKEPTQATNMNQDNNSSSDRNGLDNRQEASHQILKQASTDKVFTKRVTTPSPKKPSAIKIKMAGLPSDPLPKAIVIKRKEADIPITELMESTSHYIQSKAGIGLSVTLHNKSGKSIRVAAIDVIYLDKDKAQIGKETLYFSDVQPGETIIKTSGYRKAASASYRIGLVSAESAGLYVMQ